MIGNVHGATAQRGPSKKLLAMGHSDRCSLDQLHSIPRRLIEIIEAHAQVALAEASEDAMYFVRPWPR